MEVYDEDDAAAEEKRKRNRPNRLKIFWNAFVDRLPDPDIVFAYKTVKLVQIRDRRLGLVYYGIMLLILLYIIGYIFIYKQAYVDVELSEGLVVVTASGTAFSALADGQIRPWDKVDAIFPPTEPGAIFVPTRALITRKQTVDECGSPYEPCQIDSDCEDSPPYKRRKCTPKGCTVLQWCPVPNPTDIKTTQSLELEGAHSFNVWIKSNVRFRTLDPTRSVSNMGAARPIQYPTSDGSPASSFFVHDLIRLAGMSMEDVKETGAILQTTVTWSCDLSFGDDCDAEIDVQRLDATEGGIGGFGLRTANFYRIDGKLYRDTTQMYGIRIFFKSQGRGTKVSAVMIILQLSSALALLAAAVFAADFVMQYVLSERAHYRTVKIQETEDFNTDD
eukprot:GILK01011607.1.p1 GENE.GILK01011607.1~~GILK01011607.1.p1  ORF type:complete len:412 (-),score=58.17 GILK01011607.1:150-1319(-)